jgi:ABC-type multidrug transport system fused ATPase/permease subunit
MFTIASAFLLTGEFLMAYWANIGAETYASALIALVGVSFTTWNLTAFSWNRDQFFGATGAIRSVMRQWLSAQDIAMGLKRVFDILDIEPDIQDDPDAVTLDGLSREIRYSGVAFAYQFSVSQNYRVKDALNWMLETELPPFKSELRNGGYNDLFLRTTRRDHSEMRKMSGLPFTSGCSGFVKTGAALYFAAKNSL